MHIVFMYNIIRTIYTYIVMNVLHTNNHIKMASSYTNMIGLLNALQGNPELRASLEN